MIGMFRRRVLFPKTSSGSGGGLQDGFYFKDIMLDIPEDTYESGSVLGPGCVAITYEGPRDFNADGYCVRNAIGFGIWAVKNGSPIPFSQLTITTTGHITSADLAISDNEPSDYVWGTHWLIGSQGEGLLDLGPNDTITISCPQYNYSLVVTFDFYQAITFSDTTEWIDNECSCQGTIDYFNVSSSAPYTTLTVHVPQYYMTDNYDAISSMALTLAYCRENEGVKRLKMDSNNYFTVNSSNSLIGDTADYESLGITHSISITPVSEMSPNSSTTLTFRDYSSNTVVFTAVIYNDINTGNSHGGSGEDNHEMKPIFVEYSNGQFTDQDYYVSDSHSFQGSVSAADSGYVFTKYIVGSSELGLGYTADMADLSTYSTNFGDHNEWELSVGVSVNSALTSAWNEEGESVYEVDFEVRHVGSWAYSSDSDVTVNIYSGVNDYSQINLSVSMV